MSKRVNSSKAPKDDETLTQRVDVDAPQLRVQLHGGGDHGDEGFGECGPSLVRIWHPDDPKQYVELQFESQDAANNAVGHLNSALEWVSGMEFGEDE